MCGYLWIFFFSFTCGLFIKSKGRVIRSFCYWRWGMFFAEYFFHSIPFFYFFYFSFFQFFNFSIFLFFSFFSLIYNFLTFVSASCAYVSFPFFPLISIFFSPLSFLIPHFQCTVIFVWVSVSFSLFIDIHKQWKSRKEDLIKIKMNQNHNKILKKKRDKKHEI